MTPPPASLPPVPEADWLVETPFLRIAFQHGFPSEVGINGVRVDDVIAVAIERLERYQGGPLACPENADALRGLRYAQAAMADRRRRRQTQGVFETFAKHEVERSEDLDEDFSATGA